MKPRTPSAGGNDAESNEHQSTEPQVNQTPNRSTARAADRRTAEDDARPDHLQRRASGSKGVDGGFGNSEGALQRSTAGSEMTFAVTRTATPGSSGNPDEHLVPQPTSEQNKDEMANTVMNTTEKFNSLNHIY